MQLSKNDYKRIIGIIKNKNIIGPKEVTLHLYAICNLNCIFCVTQYNNYKNIFDLNKLIKLIDELSILNIEVITLSSNGETFLNKHIVFLINYINFKNIKIRIFTNGTILHNFFYLLNNIDELIINIGAFRKQDYKLIYNNEIIFDQVIKNLRILSKLKINKLKINIKLKFIINKLNYKLIEDYILFFKEFNFDGFIFDMMESYYPYNTKYSLNSNQLNELFFNLNNLIIKYPDIKSNLIFFIKFLKNTNNLNICYVPFFSLFININGDIYGCCKKNNYIGNLDNSLIYLWSNKKKFYKINHNCFNCNYYYSNLVIDNHINKLINLKVI